MHEMWIEVKSSQTSIYWISSQGVLQMWSNWMCNRKQPALQAWSIYQPKAGIVALRQPTTEQFRKRVHFGNWRRLRWRHKFMKVTMNYTIVLYLDYASNDPFNDEVEGNERPPIEIKEQCGSATHSTLTSSSYRTEAYSKDCAFKRNSPILRD